MSIELSQKMFFICKQVVICGSILLTSGCSPQSSTDSGESEAGFYSIPKALTTVSTYEEAIEIARKEDKRVLVFFTRIKYSRNCKLMISEIINTPEFVSWAKRNVVFLHLEHSVRRKVKQESFALYPRGKMVGFPWALFFSSNDKLVGKISYRPGGAQNWITAAEKVIADNKKTSK